jgi:hypothetical protein
MPLQITQRCQSIFFAMFVPWSSTIATAQSINSSLAVLNNDMAERFIGTRQSELQMVAVAVCPHFWRFLLADLLC